MTATPESGPGTDIVPFKPAFEPDGPLLPPDVRTDLGTIGSDPDSFGHLANGEVYAGTTSAVEVVRNAGGGTQSLRITWADNDGREIQHTVPLTEATPDAVRTAWTGLFGDTSEHHPEGPTPTTGGTEQPQTTPMDTYTESATSGAHHSGDRTPDPNISRIADRVDELAATAATIRESTDALRTETTAAADRIDAAVTSGTAETTEAIRDATQTLSDRLSASTDQLADTFQANSQEITDGLEQIRRLLDQPPTIRPLVPRPPEAPLPTPELPVTAEEVTRANDIARIFESAMSGDGQLSVEMIMRLLSENPNPNYSLVIQQVMRQPDYKKTFGVRRHGVNRTMIIDPDPSMSRQNLQAARNAAIEVMRELFRPEHGLRVDGYPALEKVLRGQTLNNGEVWQIADRNTDPAILNALNNGTATNEMIDGLLQRFGGGTGGKMGMIKIAPLAAFSGVKDIKTQAMASRLQRTRTGDNYRLAFREVELTWSAWWHTRQTTPPGSEDGASEEIERPTLHDELQNLVWGARTAASHTNDMRLGAHVSPVGGSLTEGGFVGLYGAGSSPELPTDSSLGYDMDYRGLPVPVWLARVFRGGSFASNAVNLGVLSPDYRGELESLITDRGGVEAFVHDLVERTFYTPSMIKPTVGEGYSASTANTTKRYVKEALTAYFGHQTKRSRAAGAVFNAASGHLPKPPRLDVPGRIGNAVRDRFRRRRP